MRSKNCLQRRSAGADTVDVPGVLHQGILALFEDDPWLGLDLSGVERPFAGKPIDRANTLDRDGRRPWQIDPDFPDLVLVFRDPKDPERGIVLSIEAQRKNEPEKLWTVAGYVGLLAAKHKLPVRAVLVSFSRAFSRLARSWAHGTMKIEALVLDADNVPTMTPKQARARPTAAVLAAALHGARGDVEMARIGIAAIQHLPKERRRRHAATILAALPPRKRATLMEELPMERRDELWEIEKRSGTYHVGRLAGREEGLAKGRREGRKEGRVEGRKEGRVEGQHKLILAILDVRGIAIDRASRARIRAEKDLSVLARWAAGARKVKQVSELFEPE